ncbi:TonB family protein [Novosphingobium album (ex Hu et al. 2023)]|uniref:Energy transducer TonB n=1 Tax=Novosphingobium album (ex Hu et al. 2023) TaxID=2930093 RepID=A0ABT0B1K9_9SPHN|nr:TonB family protein [Novosphingobium album (ex Hu et al. 2023)]MCJ2178813.1 energy transducer TonB [Novosphingobium album (ex Hu et al. 2023)]
MTQADFRMERRKRLSVAALVLLVHLVLVAGLIRAFTPRFAASVVDSVTQAFFVSLPPSLPEPAPSPSPSAALPVEQGAAGAPGRKAQPREAAAPEASIAFKPTQAPPVAGTRDENTAGARDDGGGTGASGTGMGTGGGTGGTGQGGGGQSAPTVKVRGDINSAKDYPRASRGLRIGASVTIDLTVGTDGRVKACRVVRPSPDTEADRITCDLATKRFRFRPATDAQGNPVDAIYRWRQRWFY